MSFRYICSRALILSVSVPTAMGLTCLSSPTMMSFLPMYKMAREEMSDWLASSMTTISNRFSLGSRLSSARLMGMIQQGTADWHRAISSRALAFRAGAVLPVPLPMRLTVCFQPWRACFMSMSASVLRRR